MDRKTAFYLVSETETVDAYGITRTTRDARKCYAELESVSAAEWFEGSRNGLNPEVRLLMPVQDYHGEKLAEVNGLQLTIYRTYLNRAGMMELYCEPKKGNERVPEPEGGDDGE